MKTLKTYQINLLFSFSLLAIVSTQAYCNHLIKDYSLTNNDKIISLDNQAKVFHFNNKNPKVKPKKGCVEGNCENGRGVYIYLNGTRYEGEFKDFQANGKGTCYYADGDKYTGEWLNHNYHGQGIMYEANGTVLRGYWKNGKYVNESKTKVKEEVVTESKTWFIGIGISVYDHIQNLNFSDDDVYRMYAFLKHPNGGKIPEKQIKLLIDEGANYERITTELLHLKDKVKENDVLLLYYSGHISNGAIIPVDGTVENKKIEFEQIRLMLSECKAKTKIAFIDGRTIQKNIMSNYAAELTGSDVTFLVSSKEDEFAVEHNALRQSLFSHFLMRGMKGGADINNDNEVTLVEVFNYIRENVQYYSDNAQTPTVYGDLPKDIIMGRVK